MFQTLNTRNITMAAVVALSFMASHTSSMAADCSTVAACAQVAVDAAEAAKKSVGEAVAPLTSRLDSVEARLAALEQASQGQAAAISSIGKERILAIVEMRDGNPVFTSDGVSITIDGNDQVVAFQNPRNLKFVALLTDYALDVGYVTSTHIVAGEGSTFVRIRDKAMDTGNRTFPPLRYSLVIIGHEP